MITLVQINIYPIKSCRGISIDRGVLDDRGLTHDRRWMIVDAQRKFITQREFPRLALVSVEVYSDHLRVTAPRMQTLSVPIQPAQSNLFSVVIWKDTVSALDVGDEAADWFSRFLDGSVRLVCLPDTADRLASRRGYSSQVSFADGYPLLVISEASLVDLNARLDKPLSMNRFRPNLVVRGCDAYAEDTWNEILIGDVRLYFVKPCERCTIPTVNQLTAEKEMEPLRTLATYRRRDGSVLFGQNLIHEGKGILEIGYEVEIIR